MALPIEPMITLGSANVKTLRNGWTVVTEDGLTTAQFEHTVLVTREGREVLTQWTEDMREVGDSWEQVRSRVPDPPPSLDCIALLCDAQLQRERERESTEATARAQGSQGEEGDSSTTYGRFVCRNCEAAAKGARVTSQSVWSGATARRSLAQ